VTVEDKTIWEAVKEPKQGGASCGYAAIPQPVTIILKEDLQERS